jgi:hypothetical protein
LPRSIAVGKADPALDISRVFVGAGIESSRIRIEDVAVERAVAARKSGSWAKKAERPRYSPATSKRNQELN